MNRLYHHYYTPTGRHKTLTFEDMNVSTGANAKIDGKWQTVSVRVSFKDGTQDRYTVQMDRDTAARVVAQLSAYLADTEPLLPTSPRSRSG